MFCSNRGSNHGCGRAFSIHFEDRLPRTSMTTQELTRLGEQYVSSPAGEKVADLKRLISGRYSLATAYRWIRSFDDGQVTIRTQLCRLHPPERGNETSCPIHRTWRHLKMTFQNSPCPIPAVHTGRFQASGRNTISKFISYRFPSSQTDLSSNTE